MVCLKWWCSRLVYWRSLNVRYRWWLLLDVAILDDELINNPLSTNRVIVIEHVGEIFTGLLGHEQVYHPQILDPPNKPSLNLPTSRRVYELLYVGLQKVCLNSSHLTNDHIADSLISWVYQPLLDSVKSAWTICTTITIDHSRYIQSMSVLPNQE